MDAPAVSAPAGGPPVAPAPRGGWPPTALLASRALPLVIAAGFASGVVIGVVFARMRTAEPLVSIVEAPAASPTPAAVAPAASPMPAPVPTPAAAPAVAPSTEPPSRARPERPAARDREVVVVLSIEPSEAEPAIRVDGERVRGREVRVRLRGGAPRRITIDVRADGFRPFHAVRRVEDSSPITIKLRPASGAEPSKASGPGGLIDL